jgi:hypothetical protein
MIKRSLNKFDVLRYDSECDFELTHKEIKCTTPFPDEIINKIYSYLDATPTAKLIKSRFNSWYYDGPLFWFEIEKLKEDMNNSKKKIR